MLFSATGISITISTLLVDNRQNTVSQIICFSVGKMSIFSIYVGSILIFFHNGTSVCIILCNLCRPLRCAMRVSESLSVFTHIVMAKRKCSINDSIKSEYLFIKGVNENVLSCPVFLPNVPVLGKNGNVPFLKKIMGTVLQSPQADANNIKAHILTEDSHYQRSVGLWFI
jgi:hypothetical protein